MSEKGKEIIVVGGLYEGKFGWLNAIKTDTQFYTHVILKTNEGEIVTRIKTVYYILRDHKPQCDAEQILMDSRAVYVNIVKLVKLMVESHVTEDHATWFAEYFEIMLIEYLKVHNKNGKGKYFAKPDPKVGRKKKNR